MVPAMRFLAFLAFFLLSTAALAQVAPIPPGNLGAGGLPNQIQYNKSGLFTGTPAYTIVANAACNGTTDDSSAINSAIQTANAAGGGVVKLPAGTCEIGSTIVMYTGVTLEGAGVDSTTIQGLSTFSPTSPMIETLDFSSLVGGGTQAGPYNWAIEDMTIDGNVSARGTGAGDDIDIYGFHFRLQDILVMNAPNDGIFSQWAATANVPVSGTNVGMESVLEHVTTASNTAVGTSFEGPHDSYIDNSLSYLNGSYGFYASGSTNYNADDIYLQNYHSYGNGNTGVYLLAITTFASGLQGESQTTGDGIDIIGGAFIGSNLIAFGNAGNGINISNDSVGWGVDTNISGVSSYGNTGDGILFSADQGSTSNEVLLSNVQVVHNSGNGFDSCNGGSTYEGNYLTVNGMVAQSNSKNGVLSCMSAVTFNGLYLNGNSQDGFSNPASGNGSMSITGVAVGDTGTDVAFGTLGLGVYINMQVYTSGTCQSGTPTTGDSVYIYCQGGGTNNSISTSGLATANINGQFYDKLSQANVTSTSGTTLTAADLVGGLIVRTGPTGSGFTDTTDTAANIIAAIPGAATGTAFNFRIVNNSTETETIAGGAGVTMPTNGSDLSVATGDWISYKCFASSSTAITCLYTGTGGN